MNHMRLTQFFCFSGVFFPHNPSPIPSQGNKEINVGKLVRLESADIAKLIVRLPGRPSLEPPDRQDSAHVFVGR